MWNHLSQLSQHTALVFQVTALPQVPQGHFGVLGPGLVSVSKALASSKIKMYLLTGLLLFTLSWVASTPVVRMFEWFMIERV